MTPTIRAAAERRVDHALEDVAGWERLGLHEGRVQGETLAEVLEARDEALVTLGELGLDVMAEGPEEIASGWAARLAWAESRRALPAIDLEGFR